MFFPLGAVEDDLRRAVKAQERARARKAVHDSSPRRIAVLASIPPVPPMPQNTSLYPSTAQMDGFSFPSNDVLSDNQMPLSAVQNERARLSSQRFARVKDSLSLPYLQSRPRTKSKQKPSMLDLPPGINRPERKIVVEQVYPSQQPSTPPRRAQPAHRESPKQLAPLPPFNPYSRPRADSLTAVVEDRRLCYSPPPRKNYESNTTHLAPKQQQLRRMNTVNDLFGRIHREAEALGLKTAS
ncbi:hypothetical protein PM082_002481 [Marasmius tenuissimus]|nr:hypothetical protein PM082_002481 [Marasmius tenuissimus]